MPLLAVNHHYIRDVRPPSGIYPISLAELENRVTALEGAWRIADEAALLSCLGGGEAIDDRLCVITFDDGLKEQMAAIAALFGKGRAALAFVPTMPISEKRVLDVHKLHMIRAARADEALADDLSRTFGALFKSVDAQMASEQYRYDGAATARLKYFLNFVLDGEARAAWADSMFTEMFGSETAAVDELYMSDDDIRLLAQWRALGTHAHSHLPLAGLETTEMRREIESSIDILTSICGRPPMGISYPYGGPSAVSQQVADIAADCGLAYGFTMARGISEGAGKISSMLLRRIDTNDIAAYLAPGEADLGRSEERPK